ncbi:mono-/di-acylglycerol lipase class 3 [Tanacetum coccineum]
MSSSRKKYERSTQQIVGHSLGGGTAAILTYVLWEQKELSITTCVTFVLGACMTWELADSGNDFLTSVINGVDLVPTFSAASVDDLCAEVTASAWLNDLRTQIEHTRILRTIYRSASALGSRLPSIASAKAKVAGAGEILRPVSSGTQVNEPSTHEDRMTEFKLWEKLEHELYEQSKGKEADVAKEMREEEEAAIAEGIKSSSESNTPETKESYRFFPAGKIMLLIQIMSKKRYLYFSTSQSFDNNKM